MLWNQRLGIEREVDIVVEGQFDGEPVTVSLEVREGRRPADITWVEQLMCKHRDLPTNRLILVSGSGFTDSALAAVTAESGRVAAWNPEVVVEADGTPTIKRLYTDRIQFQPSTSWSATGRCCWVTRGSPAPSSSRSSNAWGSHLVRPDRRDEPARHGSLARVRQWIEAIFDTLKGQLDLEAHGARTRAGVYTRIAQRLLALTAAIWHNWTIGAPVKRSLIAYDH
jgi:hypothetical protein